MMQKLIAIAAIAAAPAFPVFAADFEAPEGCETFLTVQSKSCTVSNLYRCDGDEKGAFSEAVFGGNGLNSLVSYDAHYQWLDARYMWDQSREVFSPPAEDAIDIQTLIRDGVDTFRFTLHRTAPGEDREVTVVGADVLTEETRTIDGVELAVVNTDLQILAEDGTVEYHARGIQYLNIQTGHFFLGQEEVIDADGTATPYDNSPVDFIHEGEAGFAQTVPLYECDEFEASLKVDAG